MFRRRLALASVLLVLLPACGSDESSGLTSEVRKGTCLVPATERKPGQLTVKAGQNKTLTGSFVVGGSMNATEIPACLMDLKSTGGEPVYVRGFRGLFGDYATDLIAISASDLAAFNTFGFTFKKGEGSTCYSITVLDSPKDDAISLGEAHTGCGGK